MDVIRKVIPEFALGYYEGHSVPLTDVVEKLREAAETVYLTDKYQTRGEFGELILHLLLRDYCGTIPLIAKIYFKDSHNVTVHGFDGVQITTDGGTHKLWLGESKLYKDGLEGVKDLASDLKRHIDEDYLRKEFTLLTRKLPESCLDIEQWRNLMDKHQTLDKIYSSIVVPMVCTYSSDLFRNHDSMTQEYIAAFENECRELHNHFKNKKIKTNVEVILLLLPVPSKDELNAELDKRLKAMQKI